MNQGNYPSRHYSSVFERRLQDMERRIENMHRIGTIPKDGVKYDQEKKRWFVKLEDGTGNDAFKTDWLPWETMSSGSIKISMPPKEGQSIQMASPCGNAEMASCRPYHNNTDTPSPNDKPDQFFLRVEMPSEDGKPGTDKNKILDFHYTSDGATVKIGDTTHSLNKDTQSVDTKNNNVNTETDSTKASKSHSIETDQRSVTAKSSDIKSSSYKLGGKVLINC